VIDAIQLETAIMKLTLPETGFVRLPTILQYIPVSKSTWWEGARTGRFPAPVKIGGVTAWRAQDIHALIASIAAGERSDA
jgi:predicted DNA-binding transcriptional regulator AlpA